MVRTELVKYTQDSVLRPNGTNRTYSGINIKNPKAIDPSKKTNPTPSKAKMD